MVQAHPKWKVQAGVEKGVSETTEPTELGNPG